MLKLNGLILLALIAAIGLAFTLEGLENAYGIKWALIALVAFMFVIINAVYLLLNRI